MRRRTLFGLFSQTTNQVWFSSVLVILRVVVGLQVFLFGLSRLSDWSILGELGVDAWFRNWFVESIVGSWFETILPWLMIVLGALIILGALVRSASLIGIIVFFFVYAWSFSSDAVISLPLILMILFVFFMSGGVGHIIGLDHFLYHYAREKTCITKMLVG